jgi:hypothetical protein
MKVFDAIRQVQPEKLYVVADGPRRDHPKDQELCKATRQVIDRVDWPCQVFTNFAENNMGCRRRVSSGISWVFEREENAIILEDDCLPHPTFFPFCAELLSRYRNDERIMAISGNNFQKGRCTSEASYYFSIYNHIWGWATWRRAWQHYNEDLAQWPQLSKTDWLTKLLGDSQAGQYWYQIFNETYNDQNESWCYRWTYSCWVQHGLTILPAVNLVSNIGFDERATHTRRKEASVANLPVYPMKLPLVHPGIMVRDYLADQYTTQEYFRGHQQPSQYRKLRKQIRKRLYTVFSTSPLR